MLVFFFLFLYSSSFVFLLCFLSSLPLFFRIDAGICILARARLAKQRRETQIPGEFLVRWEIFAFLFFAEEYRAFKKFFKPCFSNKRSPETRDLMKHYSGANYPLVILKQKKKEIATRFTRCKLITSKLRGVCHWDTLRARYRSSFDDGYNDVNSCNCSIVLDLNCIRPLARGSSSRVRRGAQFNLWANETWSIKVVSSPPPPLPPWFHLDDSPSSGRPDSKLETKSIRRYIYIYVYISRAASRPHFLPIVVFLPSSSSLPTVI